MRHATILVAILAFVPLASATAQVPIRPGARVRVSGHSCQPFYSCVGAEHKVGTFVAWKSDTLVVQSNGDILALPLDSVTTLEVSAGRRSPGTAVTLSALGTAVPIALGLTGRGTGRGVGLLAGVVLGPALGYVYAGEAGRGMAHAGIRAAILGAAVGGAVAICSAGNCNMGIFGESGGELAPAVFFLLGGVVATTVLAVRDINRAGDRLRARNQPLDRVRVSLGPQRDGRFGFGASVRF